MRDILFELCAETIDACLAGHQGGAARIELCSSLSEGGLTPSHGLICGAIKLCSLPIHVLVRPRGGGFVYSNSEFNVMFEDVRHAKELGAAGVVFGVLNPDSTVDVHRTRALADIAAPMRMTFHRAFDATPSLPDALETIVALGFDRILTSGGEADGMAGSTQLANLLALAAKRIDIAVGGGLTIEHADALAQSTGATHFHGSLRQGRRFSRPEFAIGSDGPHGDALYVVDAVKVREMIDRLQGV